MIRRRQVLAGGLIALWGAPLSLLVGCTPGPDAVWEVVAGDRIEADLERVGAVLAKLAYVPAQDSLSVRSYTAFLHPTQYGTSISVWASTKSGRIEIWFFERDRARSTTRTYQQTKAIDAALEKEFGRERVLFTRRPSGW